MPKLEKLLRKLTKEEQGMVLYILPKFLERKWDKFDLKKLKGHKDIYRVRKGNIRIIFIDLKDDINILSIGRKNEKTYRDY